MTEQSQPNPWAHIQALIDELRAAHQTTYASIIQAALTKDQAAYHVHQWRDTGFATVEDCECGASRSGNVIRLPLDDVPDPGPVPAEIYLSEKYGRPGEI